MVNVEYIHKVIEQQWDITIPYNPKLENPKFAANMKYLLTAVDVANEMLNGEKTTDYGNSEYATMYAADTIATNDAVRRLIKKEKSYPFTITTTSDTSKFKFNMSAKGEFVIDWGDGQTETIVRDDTVKTEYSHDYDAPGEYKIGIGGRATEYSTAEYSDWDYSGSAIDFIGYDDSYVCREYDACGNVAIALIDGSLGAIFGTIGDGGTLATQPRFYNTFTRSQNLSGSIPENLFTGVHGAPVPYMFRDTFSYTGITEIPSGLFAGISGAPAESMFNRTFDGCYGLKKIPGSMFGDISGPMQSRMFEQTFSYTGITEIPADLFASIRGAPAEYMFHNTFSYCGSLTEIPAGLFASIQGAPAKGVFQETFKECYRLTKISGSLFGNISGPMQSNMFSKTFYRCSDLTEIPGDLFAGIRGAPGNDMFENTFAECRSLTEIPSGLFAGIQGAPAEGMFWNTFSGCSSLTKIPSGLFAGISGAPAEYMFYYTFGSTGINEIPSDLFGDISGYAERGMFVSTFYSCSNLTGPSAKIGDKYLYEIWPDVGGSKCYYLATGLSDYDDIPSNWK